jgi:hypothetical protein
LANFLIVKFWNKTFTLCGEFPIQGELRQSFSACVYCMQLRIQSNYLEPIKVITLKTQLHAINAY